MNISTIKNLVPRGLGRTLLVAQKYSPEILTGVGIVGLVTASVLAARATLKLEETVDKSADRVQAVKVGFDDSDPLYRKQLAKAYVHNAIDFGKLYGPSVTLGVTSITSILFAHGIMQKRQVAVIAAYKGLEQAFAKYRGRVIEEFGAEKDEEYRLGFHNEEVTDKKTKEVSTVTRMDPNGISPYARFFDDQSSSWSKTPESNLVFVKAQQEYANNILLARGHIFLNEVYDSLGLQRTQAGSVVGWIVSKDGDNYVDFGIYDFNNPQARAFVNGNERNLLLDFNVDGVIFDKI